MPNVDRELSTHDALMQLAKHVAIRLVGQQLETLVAGFDVGRRPAVAVTVHVDGDGRVRPVRALPPATPVQVVQGTAAGGGKSVVAGRRCRKCLKARAGHLVGGTARTFKCRSCGFSWEGRRLKGEPQTPARLLEPDAVYHYRTKGKPGRPRKVPIDTEARCVACDHTRSEHEADGSKCLSARCSCRGFHA